MMLRAWYLTACLADRALVVLAAIGRAARGERP